MSQQSDSSFELENFDEVFCNDKIVSRWQNTAEFVSLAPPPPPPPHTHTQRNSRASKIHIFKNIKTRHIKTSAE